MQRSLALGLILLTATWAAPALAAKAGFDCAKATRADERAICASPHLSVLDRDMTAMFDAIRHCSAMGTRSVYNNEQYRWVQRRATCGANAACLTRTYRARMAVLAPKAEKARGLDKQEMCPSPL